MLNKLTEYIDEQWFKAKFDKPEEWGSLIVNRRKPYTYRIFTLIGENRVCLHRFDTCDKSESFDHPHPWPGAFRVLKGGYHMKLGKSANHWDMPIHITHMKLSPGCSYEITNPLVWHAITPYEETYTIMVNGPEWPDHIKHTACRTTKGKDLQTMNREEIIEQLKVFKELIYGL